MKCQMLEYQAYLYSELTIQKFCSHVRRDVRTVSAICNTNCYATKSVILLAFETYQKCRFTDTKILDLTKELFIVQIPEIEIVCNI